MLKSSMVKRKAGALLLAGALALSALGTVTGPAKAFADETDDAVAAAEPTAIDSAAVNKKTFTYTGSVIKPKITVKANGTTIAKGIVKSNENVVLTPSKTIKKVGTYKIKVSGRGAYTGTKTVTVKVYPKKPTAKTPSATTSAVTAKWSKGKNDVSGYQIKCSKNKSMAGAKTVTAGKNATSKKISGLKAGTKYYVQVRAYKTVDGKKYYSDWSAKKSVKTKAKAKKASSGTVYITDTGEKYHRGTCRYLRYSKYAISKSDAISQGYTACKVCKP